MSPSGARSSRSCASAGETTGTSVGSLRCGSSRQRVLNARLRRGCRRRWRSLSLLRKQSHPGARFRQTRFRQTDGERRSSSLSRMSSCATGCSVVMSGRSTRLSRSPDAQRGPCVFGSTRPSFMNLRARASGSSGPRMRSARRRRRTPRASFRRLRGAARGRRRGLEVDARAVAGRLSSRSWSASATGLRSMRRSRS